MVRGIRADLIDDVSAIALAKAEAFSDVGTMANALAKSEGVRQLDNLAQGNAP
jgi:hypothetical protein